MGNSSSRRYKPTHMGAKDAARGTSLRQLPSRCLRAKKKEGHHDRRQDEDYHDNDPFAVSLDQTIRLFSHPQISLGASIPSALSQAFVVKHLFRFFGILSVATTILIREERSATMILSGESHSRRAPSRYKQCATPAAVGPGASAVSGQWN